jgi:hypothetical protein
MLCLLLVMSGSYAWATNYYVDSTLPGSDSNNGLSEATPFLTLNQCVTTLNATAGTHTCFFKNGSYGHTTNVILTRPGATLKNFPGHSPVFDFNMTGFGLPNFRRLMVCSTSACNNSDPTITGFTLEGIEIRESHDGLKLTNVANAVVRFNYIHDNYNNGILAACFNCLFERNHILRNGPVVLNPSTTSSQEHGFYINGKNNKYFNNLIVKSTAYGIQLNGSASPNGDDNMAGFSGTIIANNTFAYNATRGGVAVWSNGATLAERQNLRIENNLFFENSQNVGGASNGIDFTSTNATATVIRNNVAYATAPGATNFLGLQSGSTGAEYVLTANCPTTTTGSCATPPNLVNAPSTIPASPDFHLTVNSTILLNAGRNLTACGITTDYDGVARPTGGGTCPSPTGSVWEIGAYEFGSTPDTTPPAPPSGVQIANMEI